jgi:hypothetical protein
LWGLTGSCAARCALSAASSVAAANTQTAFAASVPADAFRAQFAS